MSDLLDRIKNIRVSAMTPPPQLPTGTYKWRITKLDYKINEGREGKEPSVRLMVSCLPDQAESDVDDIALSVDPAWQTRKRYGSLFIREEDMDNVRGFLVACGVIDADSYTESEWSLDQAISACMSRTFTAPLENRVMPDGRSTQEVNLFKCS
jgi:hypothetical protein